MFRKAKPVYAKGESETLNSYAVFRTRLASLEGSVLHITAATFYRVRANGVFLAFGPARTAGGYAREDLLPLGHLNCAQGNEIVIEVAGYCCRTLSTVRQPSYLLAEITAGDRVLAATGSDMGDFELFLPDTRRRKSARYSYQRHFAEVWDLSADPFGNPAEAEELSTVPKILDRVAPYPHYEDLLLPSASSRGKMTFDASLPFREKLYSTGSISARWGGFAPEEIGRNVYQWIQRRRQDKSAGESKLPLRLSAGEYAMFDFSRIEAGFLRLLARAVGRADVAIGFSEDGSPDRFTFANTNAYNVVDITLPAERETNFLTMEPYVFRYVIVAVRSGELELRGFGVKKFEHETGSIVFPPISDPTLKGIYRAAVRTFAHNAVDIFMDCPSRERAGWLCDSYFTGKVEYALFGKVPVEEAFLENYRLFRNEGDQLLPEGAIPMCYPSDIADPGKDQFIPQWTMWFLLELEEYLNLRNPTADREAFRPLTEGLLAFYHRYENSDGLLEKLPSWNFVEWSDANKWTQDVSYPTNFLYAQALDAVYGIYGDAALHEKATRIRRVTVKQAFDGRVFLDHAVRDEQGILVRQPHCSEAGQYYALLFGELDLNDKKYAELLRLVKHAFGAIRKEELPEIHPINAFIGVYLRLEVLLKLHEYDLLLSDVAEFFGEMDRETGTLWEFRQRYGSHDHGFASYALVAMTEALRATGKL